MANQRTYDYTDTLSSEDTGVYLHADKSGFTNAKKVLYSTLKSWFKVGDQQYTEENYVTNDETLTASIDALDQQVKDNADSISASTSNLHIADVAISASEMRSLNSIPVEIIAAQGTYKAIDIISVVATATFVSTAYDASTNKLYLRFDGETTGLFEWSNAFIETTSTITHKGVVSSDVVLPLNKKVEAYIENADPTLGDGTIKFFVLYRVVTTYETPH